MRSRAITILEKWFLSKFVSAPLVVGDPVAAPDIQRVKFVLKYRLPQRNEVGWRRLTSFKDRGKRGNDIGDVNQEHDRCLLFTAVFVFRQGPQP